MKLNSASLSSHFQKETLWELFRFQLFLSAEPETPHLFSLPESQPTLFRGGDNRAWRSSSQSICLRHTGTDLRGELTVSLAQKSFLVARDDCICFQKPQDFPGTQAHFTHWPLAEWTLANHLAFICLSSKVVEDHQQLRLMWMLIVFSRFFSVDGPQEMCEWFTLLLAEVVWLSSSGLVIWRQIWALTPWPLSCGSQKTGTACRFFILRNKVKNTLKRKIAFRFSFLSIE